MVKALLALVPSLGVLFLFVVVVKAMLEGDRRERVAQAKWDKEQAAAVSLPAATQTSLPTPRRPPTEADPGDG